MGSISGSGRSPGEGNGYPLQCSCLENFMDRGAWRGTVHGFAKSDTTGHTHTHALCHQGQAVRLGHTSLHCLEFQLSHVWSSRVNLYPDLPVWAPRWGWWSHKSRGYSSGLLAVGYLGFHWFTLTSCANVIFRVFHEAEMVRKHWFKWLLSSFLPLMISESQIPSLAHCSTLSIYVNTWAENRNALKYQYK